MLNQSAVLQVPAILVVEIVSPSSITEDYEETLAEYQAIGVPEYWIVDHAALGPARILGFPKKPTISVCDLTDGIYQMRQFRGAEPIISLTFPDLALTIDQVVSI